MNGLRKMNNRRLYVLVDETLDPIYGAVQGGHCVAQYLLENMNNVNCWNNEYLIYLSANVNIWKHVLIHKGKKFSEFREPDLDNRVTAICLVDNGHIFRDLPLLKAKKSH